MPIGVLSSYLLYSVGKITLKVRNSQIKLRKLAFFLKKIKTEYP